MENSKSDKSDRGFVTVLLTTVIPTILASSVVASVFSSFYSDYYKTPTICITINEIFKDEVVVEAKNYGRDSARKLVLTIDSPYNIINKKTFATENVTSVKENQTTLSISLPRFSNEEGSIIKITVFTNYQQDLPLNQHLPLIQNIFAYATYEKGSTKNSNLQCPDLFTRFLLLPYSPLIILGILLLIAYFPLIVYLHRRIDRKIFISLLIEDIINVRANLDENRRLTDKLAVWDLYKLIKYLVFNHGIILLFSWAGIIFFVRFYIYEKIKKKNRAAESYIWDSKTPNSKINIIKNMDDYIRVDDFYRSLKQRNMNSEKNEECFNYAMQALLNIKWVIYR